MNDFIPTIDDIAIIKTLDYIMDNPDDITPLVKVMAIWISEQIVLDKLKQDNARPEATELALSIQAKWKTNPVFQTAS